MSDEKREVDRQRDRITELENENAKQLKNTNKTLAKLLRAATSESEGLDSRLTPEMLNAIDKLSH